MYRYFFTGTILLLLIAAGGVGLYGRRLPDADFTYVLDGSLKTLDPARMSWLTDIRMALGLWEGLTSYDPRSTEPGAGVAYFPPQISDDGLTYTFALREEACWSNGEPVTTADFVYGWRRAIEPGTASDYAFLITNNIAGARQYSDWRNQAVKTLTILRDLCQAAAVTPEDMEFIKSLRLGGSGAEKPDWREIARCFRQEHLAEMAVRFTEVGIKPLDNHHLQVRLERPTIYFPELLAFCTFLPVHRCLEKLRVHDDAAVTDLTLWVYDPQWVKPSCHRNGYPGLITNGPYVLKDWQFKRYLLLEKNEYYWDREKVKSDTILAQIIDETSTAFLAYERGELDWLDTLTGLDFVSALVAQAGQGRRHDIHMAPAFGTYFYNFNCREMLPDGTKNPFANARVRRAFNLAVDKKALAQQVLNVGYPPARNFIPPGVIKGYYCQPGPDYDPVQARQLMAQAGYPAGRRLPTIEILYDTGQGHEITAQAIAEMWRKNLGVNVSLKGKESKSFAEDKENHRFMIARASWFGDYLDPTTFLEMLMTGNGNNDSAFSDAPYDRLMNEAINCHDPPRRMQLLAQAEEIIIQRQMPILPLYYYVSIMAYGPQVKGIYPNARQMHPLKYIYKDD